MRGVIDVETIKQFIKDIPLNILDTSATLLMFKGNPRIASKVLNDIHSVLNERERLLDLGCGYGYLTKLFMNLFRFKEGYCIDLSEGRLQVAKSLGLITYKLDLEKEKLPFPSNYFDLVIMAGILNHLKFWDNILSEALRVLKRGGIAFISVPNLGSWIDRLSLLLGYQPPSVEVSEIYSVGLPPFHPRRQPISYVHSVTLKALKQLLKVYNFETLKVYGTRIPDIDLERKIQSRAIRALVRIVDRIFYRIPSLSVRVFVIARAMVK